MATLKACVKAKRKDGFYPVYIRVIHHKKVAYMPTDKMVNDKGLTKTGEIDDPYVLQYCTARIVEYMEILNKIDTENWTVKDVVDYLKSGYSDICFSDYARKHIDRMIDRGQQRNARNYELALQHMERFAGTTRVMFSHLTSNFVARWIQSLEQTHRAKEMYPICMRQVFKAAQLEMNDYDNGIIRIKTNPWVKVQIPKADRTEKLAITPEACREFFSFPLPESKMKLPLMELGRDVAMMVLCLAGINTVDLFNLRREDYHGGIIHYQRAKTKKFRADGAYMEMRVPAIIQPLFEKYANMDEKDDHLFVFSQRHTTNDSFCANVNGGIKQVCQAMGMSKDEDYSSYTFRHTWGTVAQNDCGASISDVAFAMNHSSGHKVTRGYIKLDFTPAWELNEKVVDFIFFSDKPSVGGRKEEEPHFRLSYRYQVHGTAFFQGKTVAELTDTGFNNVDEVIAKLAGLLPDDIPTRSMMMFRIENVDKGQTVVYQRMKGKGF
ncbi:MULTISPECIES: tyrosine-type recombinase/integrase [Mediterranea]|uniref:tyrosine-type recombinase/integrase n=1 Tax=Mediterranea TaxID=1926659 RepID=UPI0020133C18|nr:MULTISPECIES: phage integrase SAM-like domain-containing protein [Mediterranea]MCL1606700.1 site-specific integrase [Mediterranea sp. ET5]MDM8122746.1 phage integrase SAM-like domain-containing protein [Mediterranea massiliensis]MDM8197202.1 phage integrase SAM-like domain-containing protein [Mediterranea massiliensis]